MSIFGSVGNFFALDIGSSGARVVQLRRGGKSRQLVSFGAIEHQFPSDDKINEDASLGILSDLIHKSKISTTNVAIAAPPAHTFLTVTDTPLLKGEELDQAIRFQADRLIPSSLDDVQLDWAILGKSQRDENMQEVLVATVDKHYAEQRIFALEKLGLNVIAIEPEPIAMVRALTPYSTHENDPDLESEIVLDMGFERTDLVVVDGGQPRLVRSLGVGASNIVRAAAQTMSINEEQAQQLIFKIGLDQSKFEGRVHSSIINGIASLTDEVEKSMQFHNNRYTQSNVTKIAITGVLSQIPMLAQYMADRLQVNIEIGNAWMNVGFPESMYDRLMAQSNKYSVAVGLALWSD